MPSGGSQSKKMRKVGRNVKSGQNLRYKNENRHEKSHLRRMQKHIRRYGLSDKKCVEELKTRWIVIYGMRSMPAELQ